MSSPGQPMQAVPFFWVSNLEASARFYVDGLGFAIVRTWIVDGQRRWCWLERGGAAVMLQDYRAEAAPAGVAQGPLGAGLVVYFICEDAIAIYRELVSRGIAASRPEVGNGMWVTTLADPDGYQLAFESVTDAPEGSAFTA